MKTLQKNSQTTTLEIILKGWEALVRDLGISGATEFLRSISIGAGDSVKEYKEMWKGMKLEEIHKEILKAKRKGEI